MRLDQLIYIKEIERQQSISKAARELFISQPSLSVALSNLEQELGVPIFMRGTHGMMPTLMGQIILEKAETILRLVDELQNIANLTEKDLKGDFKVLLPFFSSSDVGYHLITNFQEKYPKLRLRLNESDVYKSIQKMAKAQADIAIVDFWAAEETNIRKAAEEAKLMYGFVAYDELCLFVAQGHPSTKKPLVMVEDLKDYPISSNKRNLQEYFSGHVPNGLKQGDVFEDGEHLKKALIKKKHAVAITSRLSLRDDIYIQSGKVVPLQIEEKLRRRIIIASLVSQREQWIHTEGIIYQALCDCVREYFTQSS